MSGGVHKQKPAAVLTDVTTGQRLRSNDGSFRPCPGNRAADWLQEHGVDEVVMESTAQYWRPIWGMLEQYWQRVRWARAGAGSKAGSWYLAQAQSNRGRRGRKKDDAS